MTGFNDVLLVGFDQAGKPPKGIKIINTIVGEEAIAQYNMLTSPDLVKKEAAHEDNQDADSSDA